MLTDIVERILRGRRVPGGDVREHQIHRPSADRRLDLPRSPLPRTRRLEMLRGLRGLAGGERGESARDQHVLADDRHAALMADAIGALQDLESTAPVLRPVMS